MDVGWMYSRDPAPEVPNPVYSLPGDGTLGTRSLRSYSAATTSSCRRRRSPAIRAPFAPSRALGSDWSVAIRQ